MEAIPCRPDHRFAHVFACPLAALEACSRVEDVERILSADEQQRMQRFKTFALRWRFAVCRTAVRQVLSGYCDCAPEDLDIGSDPFSGRPYQRNSSTLDFNVSHSDRTLMIGVTNDGAIGVDIESSKLDRDYLALADRYFAPEEALGVSALPAPYAEQRFLSLWTLKEACLKATGEGLAGGLSSFVFSWSSNGPSLVSNDRLEARRCRPLKLNGEFAAVAMTGQGDIVMQQFSLDLDRHGRPSRHRAVVEHENPIS